MLYENPWLFEGKIVDSDVLEHNHGFVYLITNTANGHKYIGKKLLKKPKTRQVKGKKKKSLVESDWKSYWGSSKKLLDDIQELGYANFSREILRLCKSKGECNYFEAKYQMIYGVLEVDGWYNDWIACKVSRSHLVYLRKTPT